MYNYPKFLKPRLQQVHRATSVSVVAYGCKTRALFLQENTVSKWGMQKITQSSYVIHITLLA